MVEILAKIPLYKMAHATGWPRLLPLNLTVSVTYRCNSRCLTCNVYTKKADEFTADEFDRTFRVARPRALLVHDERRRAVPALRPSGHLRERVPARPSRASSTYRRTGCSRSRIPAMVEDLAGRCPKTQVIINLSLDGVGEEHDRDPGSPGQLREGRRDVPRASGRSSRRTSPWECTRSSRCTTSSGYPAIYEYVARELAPDSFITEIAEERVELETLGASMTPDPVRLRAAPWTSSSRGSRSRTSRASRGSRSRSGCATTSWSSGTSPRASSRIPCYSGVASAQIAPDGHVWFCCIKAESMGNLRDVDYDFAPHLARREGGRASGRRVQGRRVRLSARQRGLHEHADARADRRRRGLRGRVRGRLGSGSRQRRGATRRTVAGGGLSGGLPRRGSARHTLGDIESAIERAARRARRGPRPGSAPRSSSRTSWWPPARRPPSSLTRSWSRRSSTSSGSAGFTSIAMGDGPGVGLDVDEVFRVTGYSKLAARLGVELVNLNTAERRKMEWKYGELGVPAIARGRRPLRQRSEAQDARLHDGDALGQEPQGASVRARQEARPPAGAARAAGSARLHPAARPHRPGRHHRSRGRRTASREGRQVARPRGGHEHARGRLGGGAPDGVRPARRSST